MKCAKCFTINVHNASYCKRCGYHFSKKEQKLAEKGTFVGFLKKIDCIKEKITLDFITGQLWFKILSIVLVLGSDFYFIFTNGIHLKLLKSTNYTGSYNEKFDEYYLYSENEQTKIDLYIPNRTLKLIVKHYDSDNTLLLEQDYKIDDRVTLDSNSSDDYYVIETQYKNNNFDRLKIYIYQTESSDNNG